MKHLCSLETADDINACGPPVYVYIVKCSDNTLYTGWTTNLSKRVKMHNAGKASKYTRTRLPVEIIYWEMHKTKEDALKREREIKNFSRAEKVRLCVKHHLS